MVDSSILTSTGDVLQPGDVYQEPKSMRLFYVENADETNVVARMINAPGGRYATSIENFCRLHKKVGVLGPGGSIVWDEVDDLEAVNEQSG